jgi:4-alpha-glucanotransferase
MSERPPSSARPELHALAALAGLEPGYVGHDGRWQTTTDATREALLAALGYEASSEARAKAAREQLERAAATITLAPVRVVRAATPDTATVPLQLGADARGPLDFGLQLQLEDGGTYRVQGRLELTGGPEMAAIALPMPAPSELVFGYHTLRCELARGGQTSQHTQDLIVVPSGCVQPRELLGGRRAVGLWEHLYALRSERSAGLGDLGDLRVLLRWAAGLAIDFVGINPLHAVDPSAPEVSPYYPLSRVFRSPLYLDVRAATERAGAAALPHDAQAALPLATQTALDATRGALQAAPRIDYAGAYAHKLAALEPAHAAFARDHRDRGTMLGRAYSAFRHAHGQRLDDFALFCALRETRREHDFHAWPKPLRDPRSAAVADFAARHAERVDFHRYLQLELELQLEACAAEARAQRMAIGLWGDLALGDAPFAADVWAQPELYARGASLGAPPDAYSDRGQGWGLLPLRPERLRAARYRPFIALVRQALRHVGALRIDHVMGLSRQFWIPDGRDASAGAYVRFPLPDLLGIVGLESRRAVALVIGEDLGVVPDGLRDEMARHHLLRSQVLYFERDHQGAFVAPEHYANGALVSVGTHDLPPLLGFVRGDDLRRKRAAGAIESESALDAALAERARAVQALLELLRGRGLVAADARAPEPDALVEAVHGLLARGAPRLVALALDDLCREHEPLNTPGASPTNVPNWSRRCRLSLEELQADEAIAAELRRVIVRARGD